MPDTTKMQPDRIQEGGESFLPGLQQDPAMYLIDPGKVTGPKQYSAGQLAHARPHISDGKSLYVFPVGPEGFSEQGQATLGLHHYIGDNEVDGLTVHYDESRITLTGTWPGLTSQNNMVACRNILRGQRGRPGVTLYVPGVFEQEQYVLPENWTFTHDAEDRTHSIDYSITFVRIGTHGKVKDPSGTIPPTPGGSTTPGGKPHKIFTVKANVRTLRAIAKKVYHNPNEWSRIVRLNEGRANKWIRHHPNVPKYKMATYRWPLGTKFRY